MDQSEKMQTALEMLEDADVIQVFEDTLFVRVDRESWEYLFGKFEDEDEEEE